MRRILSVLLFLIAAGTSTVASARIAIAMLEGQPATVVVAWNYGTQKLADAAALKDCAMHAKKIPGVSKKQSCSVIGRGKGPGFASVVCDATYCAWAAGYADKQKAVDAAYKDCSSDSRGECPDSDIGTWYDEEGFSAPTIPTAGESCAPASGVWHAETNCQNEKCVRKFDNGCVVHFNAPYCQSLATGEWGWQLNGCR